MSARSEPLVELPLAGAGGRPERGDAAANRARILCAARRLVREHGVEAMTMDAVAAAAGVGKGTVFRRFGDREGLTQALLDDYMRDLQEAFLHGPPPLGPGAPARERLEAFVVELIRRQVADIEPALAAEGAPGRPLSNALGVLLIHVTALIRAIDPALDDGILAGMILSATAPSVLQRMRAVVGASDAALEESALVLLRGVTAAPR